MENVTIKFQVISIDNHRTLQYKVIQAGKHPPLHLDGIVGLEKMDVMDQFVPGLVGELADRKVDLQEQGFGGHEPLGDPHKYVGTEVERMTRVVCLLQQVEDLGFSGGGGSENRLGNILTGGSDLIRGQEEEAGLGLWHCAKVVLVNNPGM